MFRLPLDTVVTGTVAGAPLAAGGAQLLALGPAAAGGFLRVGEAVAVGQAVAVALDCAETAAPAPASVIVGDGGAAAAVSLALARSVRRGMVLAGGAAGLPCAVREFEAEVELLGGGAALREGAQFTLHAGAVCQAVRLLRAPAAAKRGRCCSRFACRPELVRRHAVLRRRWRVCVGGGGVRRGW